MKRILSFLLALCMLCTLLPATALTAFAADTQIVFELGANGAASHNDGQGATTYTETVGDYTLNITGGTKMYTGARDAKGNSCIKLGTGSVVASFSFTVPAAIQSVVIEVAKYKSYDSKITVNGTEYTLSKASNDGAYDQITVDTSANKTVTVSTVAGACRAMVNSIIFVPAQETGDPTCQHTEVTHHAEDPANCTESGMAAHSVCNACGQYLNANGEPVSMTDLIIPENGHDMTINVPGKAENCTESGLKDGKKCSVCGHTEQEVIPASGHNYEAGKCTVCGVDQPVVENETYIFSSYPAGTQYTENEKHKLSDFVTMYTTECHFTSELRIYSSETHNGYVVIKSILPIKSIAINAGYKVDTLNVYGRNSDSEDWVLVTAISVEDTYSDYDSGEFSANYYQLKLDVDGANQIRIKEMTVNFAESEESADPVVKHVYVDGTETVTNTYTSWDAALNEATSGTITLLDNVTAEVVNLNSNVVLELNGNTLTVKTIDATVQDSLDGKGLIKAETAKLASVDNQLVLWDNNTNASGYRVFGYTLEASCSDNKPAEVEDNRDGKTFWNVLRFTNTDAYSLVASGKSGLDKVGFELDWDGTTRTFWFEASVVVDWGTAEKNNADKDYGFYLRITGFEKLETSGTLTVKALVQSTCDDTAKSATTSYQHTVG